MAMYKSDFEVAGGFDVRLGPGTRFPGAEDNEFAYRLMSAGHRIIYVHDSVSYHRGWRDTTAYVRLYRGYGRGQGAFYAKHLVKGDLFLLRRWVQDYLRFAKQLPRRIWQREFMVICSRLGYLLDQWRGALEWMFRYGSREPDDLSRVQD
jgi:GT2 family glycosyltransferase